MITTGIVQLFVASRDPPQLFCLSVGELPSTSKKVDVVNRSPLVSTCMKQPQPGLIIGLAVSNHVIRSIQGDSDAFVGRFNTEF
jgi:hypothetical protein